MSEEEEEEEEGEIIGRERKELAQRHALMCFVIHVAGLAVSAAPRALLWRYYTLCFLMPMSV